MTPFEEGVALSTTIYVIARGLGWAFYAFRTFVNSDH